MKKSNLFAIIFFLAVSLSGVFLLTQKSADAPAPEKSAQDAGTVPDQSSQTTSEGKYIEYSEVALANAKGQRVLFFHAPWCPQCRAIEKDILAKGVPDGFTILKVDYDSNQNLRKKYGVTLQTTFVKVDSAGNSQSKYVAYDEPNLDALKRNFLN